MIRLMTYRLHSSLTGRGKAASGSFLHWPFDQLSVVSNTVFTKAHEIDKLLCHCELFSDRDTCVSDLPQNRTRQIVDENRTHDLLIAVRLAERYCWAIFNLELLRQDVKTYHIRMETMMEDLKQQLQGMLLGGVVWWMWLGVIVSVVYLFTYLLTYRVTWCNLKYYFCELNVKSMWLWLSMCGEPSTQGYDVRPQLSPQSWRVTGINEKGNSYQLYCQHQYYWTSLTIVLWYCAPHPHFRAGLVPPFQIRSGATDCHSSFLFNFSCSFFLTGIVCSLQLWMYFTRATGA